MQDLIAFDKHQGLMHKLTKQAFARASAAGMGLDYEDIMSEVQMAWLSASRSYDQSKGAFSTYLTMIGRQHINKFLEREERSTTRLGKISASIVTPEDTDSSLFDVLPSNDLTPEEELEREQHAAKVMANASPEARLVMKFVLNPPPVVQAEIAAQEAHAALTNSKRDESLLIIRRLVVKLMGLSDLQANRLRSELRALIRQ